MKNFGAILLIFILSGCSQLQKATIDDKFILPKDKLVNSQEVVLSDNKYKDTLSSKTVTNLKYAHDKLSQSSSIDFEYMILDTDGYSYTVISNDGTPYVGLSTSFLNEFGEDQDVIVGSTAHVLAHIKNEDTDTSNEWREASMFVLRQVVSTVVSMFATPIAGYASSTALSGAEAGVKVINENKANTVGLEILTNANLSPCGYIKEKQYADENIGLTNPKKYIAAHSGIDNRAEITENYLKDHPEIVCEKHIKSEENSVLVEEIHEPLNETDSK